MIGRKNELNMLETKFKSSYFEFFIMYGRRRVGKTTILQTFVKEKNALLFLCKERNDELNLEEFSLALQRHFDGTPVAPFPSWQDALDYIDRKVGDQRFLLVFDEFPFLAEENSSIKSILQHHIDQSWKYRNIMLVLCGSNVRFMLKEVMGGSSPLYGRNTGSWEVKPFDYLDASLFFPGYSPEECLIAYGILGGIPRYLIEFDSSKSIQENIRDKILEDGCFLRDEPISFLRMEVREPALYNSIMQAVSKGHNRITTISEYIHRENTGCAPYLSVLQAVRLLKKVSPCGMSEDGKKSIYMISDNFYRFWYRFVFSRESYNMLLGPEDASTEIMTQINDYMGPVFEEISCEYMARAAKARKLPFVPAHIGKWWGNNPAIRQQDDVDVLAIDITGKRGLFCECKFQNKPMPMEEYDVLVTAAKAFPAITQPEFYFISKSGYTDPVIQRAKKESARLLMLDDLFQKV